MAVGSYVKWKELNTYDAGVVDEVLSTGGLVNVAPSPERLVKVGLFPGFWIKGVIETSSIARQFDAVD